MSGALLLVTLWSFWDDEYYRRGYKDYQEQYFKAQYANAEEEWKSTNVEIKAKELEIKQALENEEGRLESSPEYNRLLKEVQEAKIHLDEEKGKKKFATSRLDEAYYYYKKAMHEGENYDVEKAKVHEIEQEIEDHHKPIIDKLTKIYEEKEDALLKFKVKQASLDKELRELTKQRDQLARQMNFYKPFPFFWKPAEILQTVIPGYGINNFSEITYKVDRCMTCHIAYENPRFENSEEPLKTHPHLDIYIKNHPPTMTGCTWCHKGQGPATAPAEDAHGSHHETDQTVGINEPILEGDFMQANCRNCHDDVLNLEGAPVLSKAKNLFLKLGCHGCHLADGFQEASKVGPRLTRIAQKVNPSWLYRWIKKPKDYLPKTRMPDFGFSEKDALATAAFLLAASDKNYELPETFTSGDTEKGKKLFHRVGCLACHELNGKGEVFGPDLSRIANKVSPDWLISWLSNPKHYNPKSIMPNLRLSLEEASDLTAYLMQFGKEKHIPGIDERIHLPELVQYGEKVVRRRGCFACHDINGMEKESRIAPELSSFGSKLILELEFGDSHIPHNWESWVRTKLKKPNSFRTERVLDKMPNFHLSEEEIDALVVLLKGFNGIKIPKKYQRVLSEKEHTIEQGRRLVFKYNCRGCHVVEGEGGLIKKYIKSKNLYPPPLIQDPYYVGERIKASWLFSFLKNPTPVRTWVKVRMPTFSFTDKEVRDLTAYFEALAPVKFRYEDGINVKKHMDNINTAVKMVNYMDCGNCHDDGAKGIDFSIASQRLRQGWIPKWLKNTRDLIPDTKMPSHWEKENGKYTIPTKFNLLNEVENGNIDKQVEDIRDFIVSYNTVEFNWDQTLGESEEGDAEEAPAGEEEEDSGEEEDEDEDEEEEDEDE